MKRLLVTVRDKREAERLKCYGEIVYVSKYLNVIGLSISSDKIKELRKDDNVVSFRESETGMYQQWAMA